MNASIVIPSRLESSRLPGKALADICGIPLILHVYYRSCLSNLVKNVYVATDSQEIADVVSGAGGNVIMTSALHKNGTERVAEAVSNIDSDFIVNVQGDEALVNPLYIDTCLESLSCDPQASASILVNKYNKSNSISDIKTVVDKNGYVMYFSRSDIPFCVGSFEQQYLKAYHVVSCRRNFLLTYPHLTQDQLELAESNEYLRILVHGYKIKTVEVESAAVSVDTTEDLVYVRNMMQLDPYFKTYS